jgi:hypothetical protein
LVFGDFIIGCYGILFVVAEPDVRASGSACAEGCKGCTGAFALPRGNGFACVQGFSKTLAQQKTIGVAD